MMRLTSSVSGIAKRVRASARKHAVFLFVLGILCSIALLTNKDLQAAVGTGPASTSRSDPARSCTSQNTLFEDVKNMDDATDIFRERVSEVVEERLKLLQTPSEWKCPTTAAEPPDAPMPKLEALAADLPGWSYEFESPVGFGTVRDPKPVRFELFSSILMEFEREYECHLTDLQDKAVPLILENADYPNTTQFCCAGGRCKASGGSTVCDGPLTSDPLCDESCESVFTSADMVARLGPFYMRASEERTRARVAIERTMLTLRSFEVNYGYARDLMCYARASLDLRNELSLIADATSCMPKIWDALTSLHDRKP